MRRLLTGLLMTALTAVFITACDDDSGDPQHTLQTPTNLRTNTVDRTMVGLAWDGGGDPDFYEILRAENDDPNSAEVVTQVQATSFTDSGLEPGTTYWYYVVSGFVNGEKSDMSTALQVTTKVGVVKQKAPEAPAMPTMRAQTDRTIEIEWAQVADADFYRVYMSGSANAQFEKVAELDAINDPQMWSAQGLKSDRAYYFYVVAANGVGASQPSPTLQAQTQTASMSVTYRLVIDAVWSEETHPGTFAHVVDPHFSDLGGIIHSPDVSFWTPGQVASPGMAQMAVFGAVEILGEEAQAKIDQNLALTFIEDTRQIRPPGQLEVTFNATPQFSAVTFVSMIGPSPDWFIGCSGLSLMEDGTWQDEVKIDLISYDGGVRTNNVLEMLGPENDPPEPIKFKEGFPLGGDIVGSFTFTRIAQ